MRLLMPTQAKQILQGLVPKLAAPAASTISHARFCFDMAYQLCLREQLVEASASGEPAVENDFIVWGMTDSSPQGGPIMGGTLSCKPTKSPVSAAFRT